ncbi:L-threonylcarbamoyladenylate synthase [Calditrichota bacterium LG25]
MEYYKINPQKPDLKIIKRTIEVLKNGGVIVYPTNTLYGLGVDAFNFKALERLFVVKHRSPNQPISLMVASLEQLEQLFAVMEPREKQILQKILPGKFTVILRSKFKKNLAHFASGPQADKVGFRVAELPFNQKLLLKFGNPITSTSANISGKPNAATVQEIIAQFGDRLDLILDAGPAPDLKGSTIIDMTKRPYLILREGSVKKSKVEKIFAPEKVLKRKTKFVITFVCTGNICRSPMAAGILKEFITKTKFKNVVKIQSAGTLSLTVGPAHPSAVLTARKQGINISGHKAQTISARIMKESDLVIALAMNHYEFLRTHFPEHSEKIILLKSWRRPSPIVNPSVPDPIGHEQEFFDQVFNEIKREIKRISPFIFKEIKNFIEYNDLRINEN